jgi:hypothetical protein
MPKKAVKKLVTKRVAPKATNINDVTVEESLEVLIDILSQHPIWSEDLRVKVLCKMVGAHIIDLIDENDQYRNNIDKALNALGCV